MKSECPECGQNLLFYYDRYDAVCCVGCNVWFSEKCGDPNCPLCSGRPEVPLDMLFSTEEPRRDQKEQRRSSYLHKTGGRIRRERRRTIYAQKLSRESKYK